MMQRMFAQGQIKTRLLFASAVFLASFLLFLVEPISAKQLVPLFGGSAAVWITCLVFFQTALLAGYLYAHWLTHAVPRKWNASLHIVLLFLATACAIAWSRTTLHSGGALTHPVATIFHALAFSIGLPFLLLASTSPLLQLWFARLLPGGVPYRLFALSNLASLLALALYPSLIEPNFTLRIQRLTWAGAFAAFALLSSVLAWQIRAAIQMRDSKVEETALAPSAIHIKLLWLLLPMGAAMQLSAVTSHLTENIAAIPLLWILPLATYLLTLILAFEYPRFVPRPIVTRFLSVMLAGLAYMLTKVDAALPIKISIPIYLFELFVACLFCHSAAYALRPRNPSESTLFYLLFAAGGALGSFFIGIACPLMFSSNYDLALSFIATAVLVLIVTWPDGWLQRLLWSTGSVLLLYLIFMLHRAYQYDTLLAVRNFYGSLRVEQKNAGANGILRTLTNGTIQHGTQFFSPELSHTPTTYYAEDSGIGLALRYCCEGRPRRVGVVGLGVGTIAAYGHSGDTIRFYEINPYVPPIAEHFFTYLKDSGAQISIAPGDARTSLTQEAPQNFDVLAVDAFSGDSIPLHLLTRQAMMVYVKHLAPKGILAFHVSNQYVDLEPQISLLAESAGMTAQSFLTAADEPRGEFRATWVLLTKDPGFFSHPGVVLRGQPSSTVRGLRIWTDDYSSLLPVMQW